MGFLSVLINDVRDVTSPSAEVYFCLALICCDDRFVFFLLVSKLFILSKHQVKINSVILCNCPRNCTKSFRIFLQWRVTVDGTKFNSHDNRSHFKKNGRWKYIFVNELKLKICLCIYAVTKHGKKVIYTSNGMEISIF